MIAPQHALPAKGGAHHGGPVDDERVQRARQRFDALCPMHIEPAGFTVWLRQRRILVRRESPVCWRLAWFGPDGFAKHEGLALETFIKSQWRSVWAYADELSSLLDIFQPLPMGEHDEQQYDPYAQSR